MPGLCGQCREVGTAAKCPLCSIHGGSWSTSASRDPQGRAPCAGDVAQRESACFACRRPWVQPPASPCFFCGQGTAQNTSLKGEGGCWQEAARCGRQLWDIRALLHATDKGCLQANGAQKRGWSRAESRFCYILSENNTARPRSLGVQLAPSKTPGPPRPHTAHREGAALVSQEPCVGSACPLQPQSRAKSCRCEQDSNLRRETLLDFESNAFTPRPSQPPAGAACAPWSMRGIPRQPLVPPGPIPGGEAGAAPAPALGPLCTWVLVAGPEASRGQWQRCPSTARVAQGGCTESCTARLVGLGV